MKLLGNQAALLNTTSCGAANIGTSHSLARRDSATHSGFISQSVTCHHCCLWSISLSVEVRIVNQTSTVYCRLAVSLCLFDIIIKHLSN